MTQPLALISQPDDEKNHLFLAAYLKPLHDSHMNQGLFLPLSPTIFRKLPSPRQRFYEENYGFFSFFKRVLLNPLRATRRAQGTHTELKRYARPWLPWKDWKARKQSSVGCLRGNRQLIQLQHLPFSQDTPGITSVLIQAQRAARVEFSLLCPSKIPFHPFSVCELHTTPQPHLKAAKNWFESLFKLHLHTKSPWELHSQMLNQAEGLGSICARSCAHKHNSRDFTKGINPEVYASLIFPLGPGRSSGLGLNTVGDGDEHGQEKHGAAKPPQIIQAHPLCPTFPQDL